MLKTQENKVIEKLVFGWIVIGIGFRNGNGSAVKDVYTWVLLDEGHR